MACNAEPQCAVYAFIAPTCVGNAAPLCYLKSTATSATSATPCHCSGFPARSGAAPPYNGMEYTVAAQGIAALLGPYGLASVSLSSSRSPSGGLTAITYRVDLDSWAMVVGDTLVNSSVLSPPSVLQPTPATLQYEYANAVAGCNVSVSYEAVPEGSALGYIGFIRKGLALSCSTGPIDVISVSPWDTLRLTPATNAVVEAVSYPSGAMGGYGVFVRMGDGTGILATAENSFLYAQAQPVTSYTVGASTVMVHVGYHPFQHWWNASAGQAAGVSYVADAGILAIYPLRGVPVPQPPSARQGLEEDGAVRVMTVPSGPASDSHAALTLRQRVFSGSPLAGASVDVAERDAFRGVVEASVLLRSNEPITVHIPWTENDYQVDVSNATQFEEYSRILQRLSSLGISNILYAGSNSEVSNKANNTDGWGWEQTLWLNEGQHVREGVWLPGRDPLPPSLATLVAAAAANGVKLMPYVYPILAFSEDASWLYPSGGNGVMQARLSDPALQDFLVSTLLDLSSAVTGGLGGAGFDYTYFDEPDVTQYAQWFGWRRVLRNLRAALTQATGAVPVVDNRQANHAWGPWMWAAGSYAEPLQGDEGPYSWSAFVLDPHTDRQSANHQREISYLYAQSMFCPQAVLPGFMQHQTDRFNGSAGGIPENDFLVRDFDYYGAAYGVLSSIATAPANNVVCGLPARDAAEFGAFPADSDASGGVDISVDFYRTWFAWAAANFEVLRTVKPLPVPPAPGVTDGTFAMNGTGGFIFLFNPNSMALPSPSLALDASLDLLCTPGSVTFALTELYPVAGRVLTTAACGAQNISLALEGRSALVVSVQPVAARGPVLVGRAARASTEVPEFVHASTGDGLEMFLPEGSWADVHWDTNTQYARCAIAPLYVLVPTTEDVIKGKSVAVRFGSGGPRLMGDKMTQYSHTGAFDVTACPPGTPPPPTAPDGFTVLPVWFSAPANATFIHSAPVEGMGPQPSFTGGVINGTVNVPAAVFAQLAARNASYPLPYDSSDATIAWLVPGRLIAYIDVGRALGPGAAIAGLLDGRPITAQPVWSCRSLLRADCFSGYWLDLTAAGVQPDTPAALSLQIPAIPAGSFAGVFYDNVNTVSSAEVAHDQLPVAMAS